jgi:hypothetical protein
MWIIYNTIVFSLAGILSDAMSIGSIIIAEIRFRKKPEQTTTNANDDVLEKENSVSQTDTELTAKN